MKKTFVVISSLVLFAVLSLNAAAQNPADKAKQAGSKAADTTKKAAEKTADTTKQAAEKTKQAVAPKGDADIQKCIADAIAANAKLKDLGFTVAVTNGEATLTGKAKTVAEKNAAAKLAKSKKCGAKKVTNNIEVPAPAPPAKTEKKPEPPKKP